MYQITKNDIKYCDFLCRKFHLMRGNIASEDHIQDAREGLCIAAKKWDGTKARTFMSYARWWIYGYVERNYSFKIKKTRKYPDRVYPRSNEVYYQNRQVYNIAEMQLNNENIHEQVESKDLINKITATMPADVEILLRRMVDGYYIREVSEDLGYANHQTIDSRARKWRKKTLTEEYLREIGQID